MIIILEIITFVTHTKGNYFHRKEKLDGFKLIRLKFISSGGHTDSESTWMNVEVFILVQG